MAWWLQFLLIWLSVDIVVIATGWYSVTTLKPNFPNWWKRVIADLEPNYVLELQTVEPPNPSLLATKVTR